MVGGLCVSVGSEVRAYSEGLWKPAPASTPDTASSCCEDLDVLEGGWVGGCVCCGGGSVDGAGGQLRTCGRTAGNIPSRPQIPAPLHGRTGGAEPAFGLGPAAQLLEPNPGRGCRDPVAAVAGP